MVGDVSGDALVAVFGGGVAQADVLADVIAREADGAVSFIRGHGERTVGMGGGDGPPVPVPDGVAGRCGEGAVVATGDDDLADVRVFSSGDLDRDAPEVATFEAGGLDGSVEGVDVLVRRRGDGNGATGGGVVGPADGDPGRLVLESARDDPAVVLVRVEGGEATAAQAEGGVGFPAMPEAVHGGEFVDEAGCAEFAEHAAPANRLQLPRVTDEHDAPVSGVGELGQGVEGAGPDHAGLVH